MYASEKWMINYFNRAAGREMNTFESACRTMTLIWELMWALGAVDAQGRTFQEGWLWTRSRIHFFSSWKLCLQMQWNSFLQCWRYFLGLLNGKCCALVRFKPRKWCAIGTILKCLLKIQSKQLIFHRQSSACHWVAFLTNPSEMQHANKIDRMITKSLSVLVVMYALASLHWKVLFSSKTQVPRKNIILFYSCPLNLPKLNR